MKIILALIAGCLAGIFFSGLCNTAKEPAYGLVFHAYNLLVDARDTGNIEEIANVAEEAIGYLGQALE